MEIKRRDNSDFIDLDITDGDAVWYCTDRFNASGDTRLGGGRLRLRNVQWKGDTIISPGDIDYSLKVSSTPTGPQYWVSNQAGMETDMQNFKIYLDGLETGFRPGNVRRADNVTIEFTTQVCLNDLGNTRFASMHWRYVWENGVYNFEVGIDYLANVYRWFEYASATPTDGACGTTDNRWKCDRVDAARSEHTSLGCQSDTSNWIWGPAATEFKMHLSRNGAPAPHPTPTPLRDQARVTVTSNVDIPQLINDHGDNYVITYHVTNDGTSSVLQSAGDRARHAHSITLE